MEILGDPKDTVAAERWKRRLRIETTVTKATAGPPAASAILLFAEKKKVMHSVTNPTNQGGFIENRANRKSRAWGRLGELWRR